jgi:hypothetical protein
MGEVPMLLLALLVLHLSEFVVWVRPDVGLFRRRGRGWELDSRGALISTVRGSLHWVYPLPGWARAYAVPWTTGNLPAAHPEGGAGLESVFSRSEVERRRNSVEMAFRELRWLSWSLMGLVWVVAPVTLQWIGLRSMLWIVLPPLLVLMAVNAVRVFQTHRRQYPESGDERLRLVLSASLSPLAAIRSADLVHKEALEGFHPLAVAAALPGFRDWEKAAAVYWRRLNHAESERNDPGLEASSESALAKRRAWMGQIERLALERGLNPAAWDQPPSATDPSHTQYCPRCRSQFTPAAVACHDCQWPRLLPIPS